MFLGDFTLPPVSFKFSSDLIHYFKFCVLQNLQIGPLISSFIFLKLVEMGFLSDRYVIICILVQFLLLSICSATDIPAFYIFGDSLVDAGNNFYINTAARANFPNGIDFGSPFGIPSGRFTNGRIVTDILGKHYSFFFP